MSRQEHRGDGVTNDHDRYRSSAELQRWAFGRTETDEERARAASALAELARRDAAARAEAASLERGVTASEHPPAGDETHNEPRDETGNEPGDDFAADPTADSASLDLDAARHRRRMLVTGIAGVLVAALAAPVVATLLTLPDPDPLAIFDRPATALDDEWKIRLEQNFLSIPTLGPRVTVVDGLTLVAFRASTVPDGRSTDGDAYCLASTTSNAWTDTPDFANLMLNCTHAQRFEEKGIEWVSAGNSTGDGFEVVRWGPVGPPRIENVESPPPANVERSALDWMAYPNYVDNADELLALVNEPERLLMGPSAFLVADENGTQDVELALYLLAPRSPSTEPDLCLAATARRSPTASGCRPLSDAVSDGLFVYAPATEGGWNVTIRPDGTPAVERVGLVLD